MARVTWCSVVYSREHCTFFAASLSCAAAPVRYTARLGVLMFLAMLMISTSRGTPRVTFFADTPAKWNVFRVICVAGSPILCAAMVPIISPGLAIEFRKRVRHSPITQSKASGVRRYFSVHFLLLSTLRKFACTISVAFFCASTLRTSSPGTTTISWHSFCTFCTTSSGFRVVVLRMSMLNLV